MIVVIADDLTGAAEIGGIGLQFGMKVEIETDMSTDSDADLLIIATNIRSQTIEAAREEIKSIVQQLRRMKRKPELIYAKIDSVLRGHIVTELTALMEGLNKKKAVLVPANPHLGRTIENGIYYINGKKLQETSFKNDPEFAAQSSVVENLLENKKRVSISVIKTDKNLNEKRIYIGEASSKNDLQIWAKKVNDSMILSGAAGFFSALLEKKYNKPLTSDSGKVINIGKKKLFVCGSAFLSSKELIKQAIKKKAVVSLMPIALTKTKEGHLSAIFQQWTDEITTLFKNNDAVIITADPNKVFIAKEHPDILRTNMSIAVQSVIDAYIINELIIEGGATASAILKRLRLNSFFPKQELAYGVIRMQVPGKEDLYITLKPGSYHWPASLWPV